MRAPGVSLADEVELLRERVAYLESVLLGPPWRAPAEWKFTSSQSQIFRVLLTRELATKEQIVAALWSARPESELPDPTVLAVHISHIRKKLTRFGIVIHTAWGEGWRLDPRDRARLSADGASPVFLSETAA